MELLKNIISFLENIAPLSYQESYDNAGLITGNNQMEITGAVISLDCIEEVINEAASKGCNLVISHHPVIFSGLKKLNGTNYVERAVIKAIKNDIAVYAIHTNLDNVHNGVNAKICRQLGLVSCKILSQKKTLLKKLVTFVPVAQAENVRNALFKAGAGSIGNYDECSFNLQGEGTFRAGAGTQPFAGQKGERHREQEIRIEAVFQAMHQNKILEAMLGSHPYEEVAYDLYSLDNAYPKAGAGMIGELTSTMDPAQFLAHLKHAMQTACIRHTRFTGQEIKKVAVCGGAGSFLLNDAIYAGAHAFVTADFKYHQFFDADGKIIIADIGHYESEQFTQQLIYDLLKQNFNTFALHLTTVNTNPVKYFS